MRVDPCSRPPCLPLAMRAPRGKARNDAVDRLVDRNTVLAVYDDLAAEGLIEGRRGAAMVISAGARLPPGPVNTRLLLREAGYPARTVALVDADGNPFWLTYS